MNADPRLRRSVGGMMLFAALSLGAATAFAQRSPEQYKGRSLAEALQALQARGLRIVFTSVAVTPELRVRIEPRAATARQQLDELLAPHGLKAQDGPGGIIQVVRVEPAVTDSRGRASVAATGTIDGRVVHALTAAPLAGVVAQVDGITRDIRTDAAGRFVVLHVDAGTRTLRAVSAGYALVTRTIRVTRGTTVTVTLSLSPAVTTYSEHLTVSRPRPYRHDRGVASETGLDRRQLEQLHGGLADDPIRTVHTFPRVSAVDDFRSEFAVRGSPFRHVEVVVDGVSTTWLQHTAHGRGATGSLAMSARHRFHPPSAPHGLALASRRMGLPIRLDAQCLGGHVASITGAPPRARPRTIGSVAARACDTPRSRHRAAGGGVGSVAGDRLQSRGGRHSARTGRPSQAGRRRHCRFARSGPLCQHPAWIVPRHRAAHGSPERDRALGMGGVLIRQDPLHRRRPPRDVLGRFRSAARRQSLWRVSVLQPHQRGRDIPRGHQLPIPGYLTARDGGLFVADQRNEVRLPAYSRLDVRADRGIEYFGRRLTIFAEVMNVLNRANVGLANGAVRPSTGEAIGFTDRLFPRRASAGVLIEF